LSVTTFKTAIAICGFSQSEAADFFGVSLDSVKSWCSGRRSVPDGVWKMLAELYAQIVDVSEDALDTLELEDLREAEVGAIAQQQLAESLPAPALRAAIAMALLARMTDEPS
jgi:DNA-binding transcriptional regulator YdaS (Cro superfamily)